MQPEDGHTDTLSAHDPASDFALLHEPTPAYSIRCVWREQSYREVESRDNGWARHLLADDCWRMKVDMIGLSYSTAREEALGGPWGQ